MLRWMPQVLKRILHLKQTENVYEKQMKTPSNPQFSQFGPIKCREKTLINIKFLNSKVCFGGP